MPTPVTFSAPGDGYTPSPEDRLRDGVYLMLYADDVNRKNYSNVDDDPAAGVHIYSDVEGRDASEDARLVVPQQVVVVAYPSLKFAYATSGEGTKTVTINVCFFEAPDTSYVELDVDAPAITVHAKIHRVVEILMRGTLFTAEMAAESSGGDGKVVDPYATPLSEDGTYDADAIDASKYIAHGPPQFTWLTPHAVSRKKLKEPKELATLDPIKDVAVLYRLSATYEVPIIRP